MTGAASSAAPEGAPRVLVVGGTGILRDVVGALRRTAEVTVVTRRTASLSPGVRRLRLDTALSSSAIPGRFDAAVVYLPAVHLDALERIRRSTEGTLVLVIPSAALRIDAGRHVRRLVARTTAVPVLLGWTGPGGAPRWHSAAQIAPAVLVALRDRRPVLLGRLTGRRPA